MIPTINTWLLIAAAVINPQSTFLSHDTTWTSVNDQQCHFLHMIDKLKQDGSLLKEKELQCWISQDHAKLNQIAKEHDIPVTFDSFLSHEFGSLAILNLNLSWLNRPQETSYQFKKVQNKIKGLSFSQDFEVVYSSAYGNPLVKIKTQSGDILYLTIADRNYRKKDSFALSQQIKKIRKNIQKKSKTKKQYGSVMIPQFAYQGMLDATWLTGMTCCESNKSDNCYIISNPVYHVKMQCNVNGCSVKAGVGLTYIPISSEQETIIIDRPFYFWVERPGCHYPIIEGAMNENFVEQEKEHKTQ